MPQRLEQRLVSWRQRLAFRLAWRVSLIVVVALVATGLAGYPLPAWVIVSITFLAGASTWLAAHWHVIPRLARTRRVLEAIDRGDFDQLEDPRSDLRDELDALDQLVSQTGASVASEIRERERIAHYRREFLGNVSHELKTPIFSIRGFADTLLDGALEDVRVRRSFVTKIKRNAERLGNLAEDLAAVARIEMGELSMTRSFISLSELVHEVVESVEPLAKNLDVSIRIFVPEDLPPLYADRSRIGQVLSNLIDNAVKYSREDTVVEVFARTLPDGTVRVSVVDTGIGIAPEHIPRLTERFFRVDTSRSRSLGGTGLGLAIVKHILGAHGSHLLIESRPGSGSTFAFSLPTTSDAV